MFAASTASSIAAACAPAPTVISDTSNENMTPSMKPLFKCIRLVSYSSFRLIQRECQCEGVDYTMPSKRFANWSVWHDGGVIRSREGRNVRVRASNQRFVSSRDHGARCENE